MGKAGIAGNAVGAGGTLLRSSDNVGDALRTTNRLSGAGGAGMSGSTLGDMVRRTGDDIVDGASGAGRTGSNIADGARRSGDDIVDGVGDGANVSKRVSKSKGFCQKNPKMCLGGAAGVGIGGYYGMKQWNTLKKEKKDCLAVCYPDDWHDFKNGNISAPTYKTSDAVSPYDPAVEYSILYPDMEDDVCTPTNLTKKGLEPGNCKKFCEDTCDFDLADVIDGAASNLKDDAQDGFLGVLSGGLESLLGENYKMWLVGILVVIVMLIMIPIVMRFI